MNMKPTASSTPERFVEIVPEQKEKEEEEEANMSMDDQQRRVANRSRRLNGSMGLSPLDSESKANKSERRVLSRSGTIFDGSPNRSSAEGRKNDFNIFRTKSTVNRQNSMLPMRKETTAVDSRRMDGSVEDSDSQNVPNARRYFAALKGPELDEVKEHEDILLPTDELWPFLLRFPINCFGICLGLGSQSILWGALATSPATRFLNISPIINLLLWLLALGFLLAVFATYALKCALFFEAVRREFHHPVRVNFFFAPWIVCMFLAISAPPKLVSAPMNPIVWCIFMAPVFLLEVKIYGQWLSGGKRRISKVANPSSHLSVVGNFVGAILACKVGWKEAAKFFWAIGLAHYLVVFVTLYQRLPSSEALPKELHPVYSMFIAAPSAASIAWGAIYGEFDGVSRTFFFIAMFLYVSLVVRVNFFWGFRFSLAWWAYTFPMTTATVATIKYAEQVPSVISKGLVVVLSLMSSTMVSVLLISTLLHAFVFRSLFPNDLAIAITEKKAINDKNNNSSAKDKKPLNIQSPLNRNRSAANEAISRSFHLQ